MDGDLPSEMTDEEDNGREDGEWPSLIPENHTMKMSLSLSLSLLLGLNPKP